MSMSSDILLVLLFDSICMFSNQDHLLVVYNSRFCVAKQTNATGKAQLSRTVWPPSHIKRPFPGATDHRGQDIIVLDLRQRKEGLDLLEIQGGRLSRQQLLEKWGEGDEPRFSR